MSTAFVIPSIAIMYLFSYIGYVLYFQVFEHSSFCLTCIVESIASSPDKLDEICNHGLIEQVTSLISTSNSGGVQASLSTSTYTVVEYLHFQIDCFSLSGSDSDLLFMQGLIRLLSVCAKGSPLGAKTLFHLEISGILRDILPDSGLVGSGPVPPSLTRPPDQVISILSFYNKLWKTLHKKGRGYIHFCVCVCMH